MTDTLEIFGHEFTGVTGIVATDDNDTDKTYIRPQGTKQISANGTGIDVAEYATVDVSVQSGGGSYQSKSVSPTESVQNVYPDSGYDALSSVEVGAISSTYVGSGISRKSSTDLTASGATVTAPAGYYESNATKTISNGSVTTPASISGTTATVSTGTNTLTLTKSVSVTPNVTTAGYISAGTAGNASVSLQANVTTKAAATITPGTSNQTIASGTYLTGTQTISGDANLVAGNIKNGTTIFGVTGNYEGSGGGKACQISNTVGRAASSTYTAVGPSITVQKAGTYHVYWSGYRSSTSGTNGSQLYINDTAYGSAQTSFNTGSGLTNTQSVHLTNVSLSANAVLTIRARSRGNNYYMYVQDLIIIEA